MSPDIATSLRLSREIQADPEAVFEAWTVPERLERWSCPEGSTVEDVEVDLAVGGRYRIVMRTPDDETHVSTGVYREIERPRRLVYTWGWEGEDASVDEGESLVTVEFFDRAGSTEVVLTHERFPDAESRDAHEEGWTSCLSRLQRLFA